MLGKILAYPHPQSLWYILSSSLCECPHTTSSIFHAASPFSANAPASPPPFPVPQEYYEKPRKAANLAMIAALDGVRTAFAVQAPPLAAVRNLGLSLINTAGPVRNSIMAFAMGVQ
uniref:Uncharacterized protein n=1 Tax=Chlamydomonas euryale TaxID=1486919 RepID=A0A7R9VBX0_9CHLO|mmetsp:Transcript_28702/g.84907  ORF Transcript_28702/g.84907 Transcript_28702/m.84907 type:complete len:116 (+) Transcript_28702:779-1126(+)|eukprot:351215-Chlamydomonas_euryale.AAC.3